MILLLRASGNTNQKSDSKNCAKIWMIIKRIKFRWIDQIPLYRCARHYPFSGDLNIFYCEFQDINCNPKVKIMMSFWCWQTIAPILNVRIKPDGFTGTGSVRPVRQFSMWQARANSHHGGIGVVPRQYFDLKRFTP